MKIMCIKKNQNTLLLHQKKRLSHRKTSKNTTFFSTKQGPILKRSFPFFFFFANFCHKEAISCLIRLIFEGD